LFILGSAALLLALAIDLVAARPAIDLRSGSGDALRL
jgi:hypothetical protein